MPKSNKCPYCSGDGEKLVGRVAATSSHLTFGCGERIFRCRKCGETWSVCYTVPPKGSRKGMLDPHEGILNLSFIEGVRGYANPVVLKTTLPLPASAPATDKSLDFGEESAE